MAVRKSSKYRITDMTGVLVMEGFAKEIAFHLKVSTRNVINAYHKGYRVKKHKIEFIGKENVNIVHVRKKRKPNEVRTGRQVQYYLLNNKVPIYLHFNNEVLIKSSSSFQNNGDISYEDLSQQ